MMMDRGQMNLESADVIIVGVSRTSKTPTCIYLANQGIKAANYPLVPHVGISKELDNVKNTQVVALITSAHTLVEIRRKRSIELGLENKDNDYVDIHKVEEEITSAKRIFANKGWPVIDITRRSVEETASAIMNILSLKEEKNAQKNNIILASSSASRRKIMDATGIKYTSLKPLANEEKLKKILRALQKSWL